MQRSSHIQDAVEEEMEKTMQDYLPERLEERPITLTAWLIGGAVIALLLALLI